MLKMPSVVVAVPGADASLRTAARFTRFIKFRNATRRKYRKERVLLFAGVTLAMFLGFGAMSYFGKSGAESDLTFSSRRLLSGGSQCDDLTSFETDMGGLAFTIWFLLMCMLFVGLAIVTDEYFVPCLEMISEKLELSEDVAGATFMAAGSSAPELGTSMVDTFVYQSSIGIGTIVGSAVFNILVIIAAAGIFCGDALEIDYKPLLRDSFFYSVSITLLLVFFTGGEVLWWEAMVLVLWYVVYVCYMAKNEKINNWLSRKFSKEPNLDAIKPKVNQAAPSPSNSSSSKVVSTPIDVAPAPTEKSPSDRQLHQNHPSHMIEMMKKVVLAHDPAKATGNKSLRKFRAAVWTVILARRYWPGLVGISPAVSQTVSLVKDDDNASVASDSGSDAWYVRYPTMVLEVFSWPWMFAFQWTIPDAREEKYAKFFWASFVISILYIAGISFAMVTLATRCGCIAGINAVVMGETVLAAGTSIPDALGSVIAARSGMGDMAVSNALGSNVFDICLGLGIPWLIKSLIDGTYYVNDDKLLIPVIVLFVTLVATLAAFALNKWKLNKPLGYTLLVGYAGFVIFVCVEEALHGSSS